MRCYLLQSLADYYLEWMINYHYAPNDWWTFWDQPRTYLESDKIMSMSISWLERTFFDHYYDDQETRKTYTVKPYLQVATALPYSIKNSKFFRE